MRAELASVRSALVNEAVRSVFAAGGFRPGERASAITPLELLVAEQGLVVEETDGLTRASANALLAARGYGAARTEGDLTALSGYLFASSAGGLVLVNRNQDNPLVRRRYTIAHELGHYLMHFIPLLSNHADDLTFTEAVPAHENDESLEGGDVRIESTGSTTPDPADSSLDLEGEANSFAAAVLMSETVCRDWAERLQAQCGSRRKVLARRLAPEFLVSVAAMERRLTDLQLGVGAA